MTKLTFEALAVEAVVKSVLTVFSESKTRRMSLTESCFLAMVTTMNDTGPRQGEAMGEVSKRAEEKLLSKGLGKGQEVGTQKNINTHTKQAWESNKPTTARAEQTEGDCARGKRQPLDERSW